jgi:uncharacterized membrane protein YkoI
MYFPDRKQELRMDRVRFAKIYILLGSFLIFASSQPAESKLSKVNDKKGEARKEFLSSQVKIKFSKAERIARKKVPGTTLEIELEREGGKLVYSVEIEGDDGTTEVSVDAMSGEILKVEKETKNEIDNESGEK